MLNNLLQIHLKLKNVSKISPKNASETVARDEGTWDFIERYKRKDINPQKKWGKLLIS